MNEELEEIITKHNNIKRIQDVFENPAVVFILENLKSIPLVSGGIEALNASLQNSQRKRLKQVCEIIFNDASITEDMVNGVEEIFSFAKMYDVVRRLITNDKLKYIATLYKNLVLNKEKDYDEFEEFLHRLEYLSYRELEILHILHESNLRVKDDELIIKELVTGNYSIQPELPVDAGRYRSQASITLQKWNEFQSEVNRRFNIDKQDLGSYIGSISKSGFCAHFNVLHMPFGAGEIYGTTEFYERFLVLISK